MALFRCTLSVRVDEHRLGVVVRARSAHGHGNHNDDHDDKGPAAESNHGGESRPRVGLPEYRFLVLRHVFGIIIIVRLPNSRFICSEETTAKRVDQQIDFVYLFIRTLQAEGSVMFTVTIYSQQSLSSFTSVFSHMLLRTIFTAFLRPVHL